MLKKKTFSKGGGKGGGKPGIDGSLHDIQFKNQDRGNTTILGEGKEAGMIQTPPWMERRSLQPEREAHLPSGLTRCDAAAQGETG